MPQLMHPHPNNVGSAPEVQDVETTFEEEADPPNQNFEMVDDKEDD